MRAYVCVCACIAECLARIGIALALPQSFRFTLLNVLILWNRKWPHELDNAPLATTRSQKCITSCNQVETRAACFKHLNHQLHVRLGIDDAMLALVESHWRCDPFLTTFPQFRSMMISTMPFTSTAGVFFCPFRPRASGNFTSMIFSWTSGYFPQMLRTAWLA